MRPRDVKKSDVLSRIGKSEEGIGGGAKGAKEEAKGEDDSMIRSVAGMDKVRVEEIHVALRKKVVTSGSMGHMEPQRRVSRKTLCDYLFHKSERREKRVLVEWFPRNDRR